MKRGVAARSTKRVAAVVGGVRGAVFWNEARRACAPPPSLNAPCPSPGERDVASRLVARRALRAREHKGGNRCQASLIDGAGVAQKPRPALSRSCQDLLWVGRCWRAHAPSRFLTVAARPNARASIVHRRGGARHRAALCVVARRPRDPRRHVAHDTCALNTCVRFGRSTLAINFRLVARARRFATAWLRGAQRFKGRVNNVGNFARALRHARKLSAP